MPNPKGNPNLHGNKNSGRKSASVEFDKMKTILKAWQKVDANIDNELAIAAQIVLP